MTKRLPASIEALKQYAKVENTDFNAVMAGLQTESDRALIVIAGSIAEDSLSSLIRAYMRLPDNNNERDEMWGPQGVVGTFSAKIKLAFAMSLIEEEDRVALNHLREIRNACAHSMMPVDLGTDQLAKACYTFLNISGPPRLPLSSDDRDVARAGLQTKILGLAIKFERAATEHLSRLNAASAARLADFERGKMPKA